jgi:hypothetical protein
LYDYRHIQRRHAAGTPLAGYYARIPAAQIDIGRNGVRADRAMCLPLGLILDECFHGLSLTSSDAE